MATIRETAEGWLPLELHRSFDCALPQEWVDDCLRLDLGEPRGHFVWLYDSLGEIFGRPYPLDSLGRWIVINYNLRAGSQYPTTQRAVAGNIAWPGGKS